MLRSQLNGPIEGEPLVGRDTAGDVIQAAYERWHRGAPSRLPLSNPGGKFAREIGSRLRIAPCNKEVRINPLQPGAQGGGNQ